MCLGVCSFCCHTFLALLVHVLGCASYVLVRIGGPLLLFVVEPRITFADMCVCVLAKLPEIGGGVIVGAVSLLD